MTDNKIANAELEKLGFKKDEPQPTQKMDNFYKQPKHSDLELFPEPMFPDLPPFLDRRKDVRSTNKPDNRHKEHLPKVRTGRSTPQRDDAICNEMSEVGSTWVSQGCDTTIPSSDIDHIVNILATNMGNIIEHGGLIYKDDKSNERLKKLLSAYLKTQVKHWNGSMYRYIKVGK